MAEDSRIDRLRTLMEQRGYDAVVLRNNPDLRWLTGASRVFDAEAAHTIWTAKRLNPGIRDRAAASGPRKGPRWA